MKSMKSMKSMKLMKFTALFLIVISILSCSEEESMENDNLAPQNSFKKIDMNSVGSNYDQLVKDIQSHNNLDFTIGEMNFEMRNMKPVEGLDVENTIILEDEIGDRTIIVDNNVRSIYVRYTDNANEINYTLYGYEDPKLLAGLLKTKEYNIDLLRQNRSSKNVSNKFNEKLHFKSTETSFVIGKAIVTTTNEQDLLSMRRTTGLTCSMVNEHEDEVDVLIENGSDGSPIRPRPSWNLKIYKRRMYTNVSSNIDLLIKSFKSLSSEVVYIGSDQSGHIPLLKSNSNDMPVHLYISYIQAPHRLEFNNHAESLIRDITSYLENEVFEPKDRNNIYIYLKENGRPFSGNRLGMAVSRETPDEYHLGVVVSTAIPFVHVIGHTLGAFHFDDLAYDMTETDTYYLAYSVMYSSYGGSENIFIKPKFYNTGNRWRIKKTLNGFYPFD